MSAEEQKRDSGMDSPDFRAVAKVAQRIRLDDVRLRWSQLGRFTDIEMPGGDWGRKAYLFFDSHAAVPEDGLPEDDDQFLVQSIFQLRYFSDLDSAVTSDAPEPDEENPPDVAIEAIFDLIYRIDSWEGTTGNDFQHFALANGTHNAWPYWRELAQASSLRLGLPPYIAGPFKLPSSDDPPGESGPSEKSSRPPSAQGA